MYLHCFYYSSRAAASSMDKMRSAVHFGSGEVLVLCASAAFSSSRMPRASSALLLHAVPSPPHDKKRVLFCGFAEANFFVTWGNAENRCSRSQKSTEKWGVFIMGDFVVREVDCVRRTNKAILGCAWNRRCACVFVVRCNREVRCKARKSLRKLPIR